MKYGELKKLMAAEGMDDDTEVLIITDDGDFGISGVLMQDDNLVIEAGDLIEEE